jgi:DNA repair exonuclease SbcCD ATPase subunit
MKLEIAKQGGLRRRVERMVARREVLSSQATAIQLERAEYQKNLDLVEPVSAALEALSQELFQKLLRIVEQQMTDALQEVLEQPIVLRAKSDFERNTTSVDFSIERDGQTEDVYKGQGGSVANILSVGLRMLAITTLDQKVHRRFLVLDEQDCWLQPQLVPRLVNIVKQAGVALGFQVIMISHHDVAMFEQYADRIYQFQPQSDGSVQVELLQSQLPDSQ